MRRVIITTALAAALVAGGAAEAAWSARGNGTAAAGAGQLGAPTGVVASLVGTTATVTWTAPAQMPAGSAFRVTRTPAGGACLVVTAATCLDAGLAPGSYSYEVRTIVGDHWQSAAAASGSVVVIAPPALPSFTVVSMVDSGVKETGSTWTPRVRVEARNHLGVVQGGVTVTAGFVGPVGSPVTGAASCTTGAAGTCEVVFTPVHNNVSPGTVTITGAAHPTIPRNMSVAFPAPVQVVKR